MPVIENYSEFVHANIWGPDTTEQESPIKLNLFVLFGLNSKAEQKAKDLLIRRIHAAKEEHNFTLVRQELINIDGYQSNLVEFTYDLDTAFYRFVEEELRYISTRDLNITIPRNGMVYEILISASQNEWNTHQKEIQHILDTFKWK